VKHGNGLPGWIGKSGMTMWVLLVASISLWAQEPNPKPPSDSMAAAIKELQEQVQELRAAVVEVRSEAAQYRAETAELKRELQATRSQLAASGATQPAGAYVVSPASSANPDSASLASKPAPAGSLEDRVASLEESSQLLHGKVDEQYQTKVESASKYRVRLSGIVLLNLFSNRGATDNQDFPTYVTAPNPLNPNGSFGATLRQSEIGLEVFGPRVAGARTSGEVQLDFSGGFPNVSNGANFGLVRLRTASMRMDWGHTSIVAGQDSLFLSPLSPTSFASLAVPAFAYAGNLWGWIPQVRVEHRFELSERQDITIQGGIFDNLTGDRPYGQPESVPQAGERSGQPGYGIRVAWKRDILGLPLTLGTAGYYSRQEWGFNRHVDGWAGMADWEIPLAPRVSLSGEFYRGLAVGGFGGGIGRSVLFGGDPLNPYTVVQPLDSIGGWSQLKFKANAKLEFNGAFGLDNPTAEDVRGYSIGQGYVSTLVENRSALVNFIYRPRSNLLFSAEYRHLRTFVIDSDTHQAEQVNLMMGILF
jgi:hypothetical protein